jgi:hypothetical protein
MYEPANSFNTGIQVEFTVQAFLQLAGACLLVCVHCRVNEGGRVFIKNGMSTALRCLTYTYLSLLLPLQYCPNTSCSTFPILWAFLIDAFRNLCT